MMIAVTIAIFFPLGWLLGIAMQADYTEKHPVKTEVLAITYPTGYEIWDEANKYRATQNKSPLTLDKRLCNNIAARAKNFYDTNSHGGIDEFHQKYMPSINPLIEILAHADTAQKAVEGWASSPSHNTMLLDANRGCAYSEKGYSVMLLN